MDFESLELNKEIRANVSGNFVKLSKGITHYELDGDKDANLVVFIHGFSIPMIVWDNNIQVIKDAGYQVLRLDLFGRGYSDRPKEKYNPDLFDNQLIELLNVLNLSHKKITLVGLSMGGAVTMIFADRHPERVEKIILCDPAGMPQKMEFKKQLLKVPVINKILFHFIGNSTLINGVGNNFHHFERYPDFTAQFTEQMKYKGYRNAIVSTYRYMPMFDLVEEYRRVGASKIPLMLIWGKEDLVIPFNKSDDALKLLPSAEFHALEDTGHNSNYENPDEVNSLILHFLHK